MNLELEKLKLEVKKQAETIEHLCSIVTSWKQTAFDHQKNSLERNTRILELIRENERLKKGQPAKMLDSWDKWWQGLDLNTRMELWNFFRTKNVPPCPGTPRTATENKG